MQTKSIVECQSKAQNNELVETLLLISVVAKKLANRVKHVKNEKEDLPSGKAKRIIRNC